MKKFKMERKKYFSTYRQEKRLIVLVRWRATVRGCLDGNTAGDGKVYHEVTKAFENTVVHVLPDVLSVCFCDHKFHLMKCAGMLLCAVDRGVIFGSYVCLPLACPCVLFVGLRISPIRCGTTGCGTRIFLYYTSCKFYANLLKIYCKFIANLLQIVANLLTTIKWYV